MGSSDEFIFLLQSLAGPGNSVQVSDSEAKSKDCEKPVAVAANPNHPVYALSVYYDVDGSWHRVASPDPIPMFAQCSAVDGKLVILGGWDPVTLNTVPDVRILDLVTGQWRRGKPMLVDRSFFACAAVDGKVYVAGGHDNMKNALRTAEVNDVEANEWTELLLMEDERDECMGVAVGEKFWVISGYGTDSQGRFSSAAKCYDSVSGEWVREEEVSLEDDSASACFAGGGMDGLWCVGRKRVREYMGQSAWREASLVLDGMKGNACAAAIRGGSKVFVMGSVEGGSICGEGSGGGYGGWVIESGKWKKVVTPIGFSRFVYSAAAFNI